MNLALEYIVRRGIAQDAIESPCSLFLTHLTDPSKRIVVTISWVAELNKYNAKQWQVSDCYIGDLYPQYSDSMIAKEELFSSDFVVIPTYRLLPFMESPYTSGVKQINDGYRAKEQEAVYQLTLDAFLNPTNHQKLRLAWLWTTFLRTHNIKDDEVFIYKVMQSQTEKIQQHCPAVWEKWLKWLQLFNPSVHVATELVFYAAYETKVSEASTNNWHPWEVFESKQKIKKKKPAPSHYDNYGNYYSYHPYQPSVTSLDSYRAVSANVSPNDGVSIWYSAQ